MDASIVKVLQAVQEEFPPKRPSSSGSRKSPPLALSSPRSSHPGAALPSTSSSPPPSFIAGKSTDRPEASSMAGPSDINPTEDRIGEMQYDKQGHQNTTTTPSKKASPKPTFMQLPPKSHMNPFGTGAGKKTEFGMKGSDNLMLTPARDDLTFIFKNRDAPLAAL